MKKRFIALVLSIILIMNAGGCKLFEQQDKSAEILEEDDDKEEDVDDDEFLEEGKNALYGLNNTEIDVEKAFDNFTIAAENGNEDANFYLGALIMYNDYPARDYKNAKIYFEENQDNIDSKIGLGLLYASGNGVGNNTKKAIEIFESAIDDGYMEGYYGLGCIDCIDKNYEAAISNFEKALECENICFMADINSWLAKCYYWTGDYTESFEYFETAMELGSSEAFNNFGGVYLDGIMVEQNFKKAMECYEKAADLGNVQALNNIGYLYNFGLGVEQNYETAIEYYEESAEFGNYCAYFNIGVMYEEGTGVEQDYTKAFEYYEKAAEFGYMQAINNIGYLYSNGLGVEQNYEKAFEYYEKAAELGSSYALTGIGNLYEKGLGVDQDYEQAMQYYKMAAELGDSEAFIGMGYLYENGFGVEQDYEQAQEYYDIAEEMKQ